MNNKTLNEYTKEELIGIIGSLKKQKKFGLVWEDKPEKVATECGQKLPVVKEITDKAIDDVGITEPTNFIIEGDNYHALSVLNYTHAGKIDAIYIDPPYNTGARDWRYNNNYVDGVDAFRHSKWLSFMEKRLWLAKTLLKDSGIICVTIDDYELPHLWLLMEEIFGYENHLGTVVIRNNPKGRMTERKFSLVHEYGLFFGKNSSAEIKKLPEKPEEKTHNYKQDSDGSWYLPVNLRKQGVDSSAYNRRGELSARYFPIYVDPSSGVISTTDSSLPLELFPIDSRGEKRIWRRSKDAIDEMYRKGEVFVNNTKANGIQLYFKFRGGLDGKRPQSIWTEACFSASDYGTKILDKILGEREKFNYPKAPEAVKRSILSMSSDKNAIILDFFAGSGTTGQAVMELNKEDGGHRQFILCTNNENKIAEEVTYPRIKAVVEGYGDTAGISANVRYFRTDFVEKDETLDKLRRKLSPACEDMIRIREGAFDRVIDEDKFKVYKNSRGLTAVIFDRFELADYIARIEELETNAPVHLYVFSYTNYGRLDELSDDLKHTYESQPIPEGILEIYKRIFSKGGKR